MKKLLLLLAVIILNGCAVLDTIDTDSYVQYVELERGKPDCLIIKQARETHGKRLAKYNYVVNDGIGGSTKVKLFLNQYGNVDDTVFFIIRPVIR